MQMKEFDDLSKNDQQRLVKMTIEGLSGNVVNHLSATEISINEEKINMITRQYAYLIHKKLWGAFSKGSIECP